MSLRRFERFVHHAEIVASSKRWSLAKVRELVEKSSDADSIKPGIDSKLVIM
jgi:hypothetical protein